jgi:hypothetical protein
MSLTIVNLSWNLVIMPPIPQLDKSHPWASTGNRLMHSRGLTPDRPSTARNENKRQRVQVQIRWWLRVMCCSQAVSFDLSQHRVAPSRICALGVFPSEAGYHDVSACCCEASLTLGENRGRSRSSTGPWFCFVLVPAAGSNCCHCELLRCSVCAPVDPSCWWD